MGSYLTIFYTLCAIVAITSQIAQTVEARFSFSSLRSDLFSSANDKPLTGLRARRLDEFDPCTKYGDGHSLPAGHPCAAKFDKSISMSRLITLLRVGHHPPGVGKHPPGVGGHPPGVGKHPPGVGKHPPVVVEVSPSPPRQPPGVGRHPPGVGNHPPGVGSHPPGIGKHPPGIGRHPPGVGKHPPGVGRHPPGVGRHPPGVGRTCRANKSICYDPTKNTELLSDPTAITCCRAKCYSLENNPKHCGACGNRCSSGSVGPTCCKSVCTDTKVDNLNCGICGNMCSGGQVCANGQCVSYGF